MGAFYRRYRRLFIVLLVTNAAFGLANIWFAWGHMVKQEWLLLGFSAVCAVINIWVGYQMYKNWREVQQEEKGYMWRVLGDKSIDNQM